MPDLAPRSDRPPRLKEAGRGAKPKREAPGRPEGPRIQSLLGNAALARLVRRAADAATSADRATSRVRTGAPLPAPLRRRLERQFSAPLTELRVHADAEGERVSRRHSALAVSKGAHVYFAPGAYAPGTERGDQVLRHEVTHYLQRRGRGRLTSETWPAGGLEAEAELAARARSPISVRGIASPTQPLYMKTFVSTVGGNPYLENAVKFYKLWENEKAERIGSYQDIVNKLSVDTVPLSQFRIVAHANGLNLFLPLLAGAETYADLPTLGVQTTEALGKRLGDLAHLSGDITSTAHGYVAAEKSGKALLAKLGLTGSVTGLWKEFVWWVVDEYYASTIKEDPATGSAPKNTTKKQRLTLQGEIRKVQASVKAALLSGLPTGAKPGDVDNLRSEILAALKKNKYSWSNAGTGYLKERLDRLRHKNVLALRREVAAGTFETKLAAVKSRVSDKTHIEVRGCNIGSNDAYLNGIRAFFGTKPSRLPSISAPKLFQFFGRPGVQVLPEGKRRPPIAESLKFLFEETFDDASTVREVTAAVRAASLTSVTDLVQVLRYADIKAEFEAWWKMKQRKGGVAAKDVKAATLKDFRDFLTTKPARTFPINAPGISAESLWFMILIPSTAIEAIVNWLKDQGYTLPGGADLEKTFFGKPGRPRRKRLSAGLSRLYVDWLGDNYPVPDKIYFREDPEYNKNIRKLP